MRITRSWMFALLVGLLGAGCQDQRSKELSQIRQAERGIRPFNPAALHDPARLHVALKFKIVQDSLQFQPDSVFLRPGRMPYRPRQGGDFTVTLRDSANHAVVSYTMEDPRFVRSCDFPPGEDGEVTLRTTGQVEILVPADTAITFLDLLNSSGKVQHFPIGDQLKLVVPP